MTLFVPSYLITVYQGQKCRAYRKRFFFFKELLIESDDYEEVIKEVHRIIEDKPDNSVAVKSNKF